VTSEGLGGGINTNEFELRLKLRILPESLRNCIYGSASNMAGMDFVD
jgi:hypothetical protein